MSVKSKLTWRDDEWFGDREDPILMITIEGWSDFARFTEHMMHGQVEFADEAYRIRARVGRRYGLKRARELFQHFTGRSVLR